MTPMRSPEARREEAVGLARAIDLEVVGAETVSLNEIRPATYIGKGKVEAIAAQVKAEAIDLVVMDCALSPAQQRNLEKAFGCKVIDRTGLILEIFGQRARTAEGALQVELAHLKYQRSRLVRSWTHLERQRGGFGFLGGPGETQIETDRRLIGERIVRIERELETVKKRRSLQRASRSAVPYPIVALVGYTNAGQVDPVQSADPRRGDGGRHAVRHPRSDHAPDPAAPWRLGDPLRHGRLHLGSADDAHFRLPRHARGSALGRRHRACARHLPPRQRSAGP